MELIPRDLRNQFMHGDHTMHHNPCLFNGEWSDMAIKTKYMEKGKSSDDQIVENTNDEDTVYVHAYSLHER